MGVSYNEFISAVTNYYNAQAGISESMWGSGATWTEISKNFNNIGVNTDTYINSLEDFPELFEITRNADGTVLDASLKKYSYYGNVSSYHPGSALDSNSVSSTVAESTGINISGITSTSTTGALEITGGIGLKADTGLTAKGVVSTIGASVLAVGVGATLGKIIGDGLYNANPDFWATGNLEKLSETDWKNFAVAVKDDIGTVSNKGVLALWGVDDDTTTMYADENAVAYLTWYLNNSGALDKPQILANVDDDVYNQFSYEIQRNFPLSINSGYYAEQVNPPSGSIYYRYDTIIESSKPVYIINITSGTISSTKGVSSYAYSAEKFTVTVTNKNGDVVNTITFDTPNSILNKNVYGGRTEGHRGNITYGIVSSNPIFIENETSFNENEIIYYGYTCIYGTLTKTGGIDGITDNPNSTQFDPTGIGSVTSALGALKNQYPNLWDNAIKRKTIQDDGTEDERTYIPIPIPNFNNEFDEKPTTGTPSQTDPSISPKTTPEEELNTTTQNITKDPTNTDNPNTGGGDTPTVIVPTQQASSLWAIYNPTLGELNSLGAWLWSSDFIDQILKIFNDPMQSIIGLHKVYASPVISGSGTIKVGYLDSGVSSNIVGNQYTYINCGSVSLREYYGNVLDYSPFTTVQLYLPFIGIVALDVSDITRSTISIKYGVDVLTGACLASVSVQRDGAGGVLYQYSGNCACQYPLSSGSYIGMITGAIGTIGSLAKGNIFGSALGVSSMRTSVEHSGGFSGNAGAMGIKKPYLIISRPQSAMNNGFPALQGYPSNSYVQLKTCNGFTQVKSCHVDNIGVATDEEKRMIEQKLIDGIIIN